MALAGPVTLQLTRPQGDMTVAAHPAAVLGDWIFVQSTPLLLRQLDGLDVPAAFLRRRRHARLCLPAALRLLSWVPWALVPHASGLRLPPAPRYCALLRLPSSVPVGALCAPFRYLEVTRSGSCSSRFASGLARRLAASANPRLGVVCAGHPHSGCCSQGDG